MTCPKVPIQRAFRATQNDYSGNYFGWKTYATSGITGFIHFNGPYEVRNGSFVAYQGNVYESTGGHPLDASSWSYFGGAQPTASLTQAMWGQLNTVPANGTVIAAATSSPDSGGVFVVAGGAPIYTTTCMPFCSEPTTEVDGIAF